MGIEGCSPRALRRSAITASALAVLEKVILSPVRGAVVELEGSSNWDEPSILGVVKLGG